MIAEPFLLNEDCSVFVDNDTSTYAAPGDLVPRSAPGDLTIPDLNSTINQLPAKSLDDAQQMTQVRYAFWIMAALMVRTFFLLCFILH